MRSQTPGSDHRHDEDRDCSKREQLPRQARPANIRAGLFVGLNGSAFDWQEGGTARDIIGFRTLSELSYKSFRTSQQRRRSLDANQVGQLGADSSISVGKNESAFAFACGPGPY